MTGILAAAAFATIALPVVSSSGETTMTFAPLVIASSACEICVASDPCALFAITRIDGSSLWTALIKSGLSCVSKRAAHVEQGIRKAILPATVLPAPVLDGLAVLLQALAAMITTAPASAVHIRILLTITASSLARTPGPLGPRMAMR